MTERDVNVERAAEELRDSVRAVPGDFDHPDYEQLEALVDGTLDEVDRESVSTHVDVCQQCSEDVADLHAMRATLAQPAAVPSHRRWKGPVMAAAVAASLAASLILALWLGRGPAQPASPQVATAPVPATPSAVATTPQDPLSPEERAVVDGAVTSGRIDVPTFVTELQAEPGTLLGDASSAALIPLEPIGTAVASARPVFRWQPVNGAVAYSIAVFDDRFREVARASRIAVTNWAPEADLPRSRALAWQVTAHRNGSDLVGPAPPQPEARFRIVDADIANRAREQTSRLTGRPLELGILLARAGLIDDAREQLRKAEANAATAAPARALLASLSKR